ncbi:MAG: DegT/DnrJ/EryC1/StrS family aminotransferase [Fibrobacter sp.]|nr:DegT/DnrJ/EryC1/StrS family aminotransferase [Fibrobacter sp.]
MMPFVNLTAQREAYREELETAERAVLDSGCYIGGPEVAALEKELADYCNSGNSDAGSDGAEPGKQGSFAGKDRAEPETRAIACASGTDALTIALMTLGIKPGDEVIVPDFTFIAPAECVAFWGGTPRFADIDPETLLIDPESVKALIGPKTRGIIGVDLFGQVADFNELWEIAVANDLWLLEDAAQAFGATFAPWEGISPNKPWRTGTIGSISITSFYPSKPLGCYGDGGAIFTHDAQLAEKVRMLANHGSKERYLHETVGLNSRLDALQAAILRVKLRHLEEELKVRRENARKYDEFFAEYNAGLRASAGAGISGASAGAKIVPQKIAHGNTSTYAQYTVLADDRNSFIAKLDAAGIPHCIHYPMPLHEQPCFRGLAQGSENRNAIMASQKAVSLPVCAFTDVDFIINKLRSVL